jgi:hypothetical protein
MNVSVVEDYIAKLTEENTRKRRQRREEEDSDDDAKQKQIRDANPVAANRHALEKLMAKIDTPVEVPEPEIKSIPKPKDIIANVLGASSGAGSGEFHIYRTIRRREHERLKLQEDETQQVRISNCLDY